MQQPIRIIGIDPGLRNMGWGIIDCQGSSLSFVAAGTIQSNPKAELATRLCELYNGLVSIHEKHNPVEAAIEQTFVNKDAKATLKLGQARGVAMVVSANSGLSVAEYAPNSVKKSVIGVGHGDKTQIKMMVDMLLPKAQYDSADAADALAIAICHAHNRGTAGKKIAASF